MSGSNFANLRPMNAGDLEQVLTWRNHPEVRRFMYTQHEIHPDEHARWFLQASKDPQKHLLVFESNNIPLGLINISQISGGNIADWGFYAAPDAPKGTGRLLGQAGLRYAFEKIKMHKLCGQALVFNERSIRFHLSLGFQREGILQQQYFDGHQYHDVVCFGLLAINWCKSNR